MCVGKRDNLGFAAPLPQQRLWGANQSHVRLLRRHLSARLQPGEPWVSLYIVVQGKLCSTSHGNRVSPEPRGGQPMLTHGSWEPR